jgi:hypothetical protein
MKPFIKDIKGIKTSPEPDHHEFRFPGGSVNIQRTSTNNYWVHVEVIKEDNVLEDVPSQCKAGKIIEGRADTLSGVTGIDVEGVNHIAFLVTTENTND